MVRVRRPSGPRNSKVSSNCGTRLLNGGVEQNRQRVQSQTIDQRFFGWNKSQIGNTRLLDSGRPRSDERERADVDRDGPPCWVFSGGHRAEGRGAHVKAR